MPKKLAFLALIAVAAAASGAEVQTYTPSDLAGVRSIAMGDAFRAVGTSNDAIVDNPAALGLAPRYELDGMFGFAFGAPATFWNASVVDSNSSPLAMGVSYTHLASGTGDARFSGSDTRLALAVPLADFVFLGVSGNWLDFGMAQQINAITGDAALIVKPIDILTISGIGYNLIGVENNFLAPRKVALAAAVGTDATFHVAGDAVANLSTTSPIFDWHLGGEYFLAGLVALRAGWMYDGLINGHFLSAGAGIVVQGFAFDVAYRQQLIQWNDNMIIAGIKFFLPS